MPYSTGLSNSEVIQKSVAAGELEDYDPGAAKLILDLVDQLNLFHDDFHENRKGCNLEEIGIQTYELLFSSLCGLYLIEDKKSEMNKAALDMHLTFAIAGLLLAYTSMNKTFGSLKNPAIVARLMGDGLRLAIKRTPK